MKCKKTCLAICMFVLIIMGNYLIEPVISFALYSEDIEKDVEKNNSGMDIVMVVDNSEDMWPMQGLRNDAMSTVLNGVKGDDINIGCVYFADGVYNNGIYKDYSLKSIKTEEGYQEVSRELTLTLQNQSYRGRNIGKGLKKGRELFDNHDTTRKKVMMLLLCGVNENPKMVEKQSADKLTKEQVELLKDENIALYCVYIQKYANEKSFERSLNEQTDEAYLKEIVNYFDENNHYDESRFFFVDEDKSENEYVSELYDGLAEFFYSLRENIEYSKISLDSEHKCIFNVPKSGISRIQVYVKGKVNSSLRYLGSVDNEEFNHTEPTNNVAFFTVDHPEAGDWEISLSSENLRNINASTVMLAYYKGGNLMPGKFLMVIILIVLAFVLLCGGYFIITIINIKKKVDDYIENYDKLENIVKALKKIKNPIPNGIKKDIEGYMESYEKLYNFCEDSGAPDWVKDIIIGESFAVTKGFEGIADKEQLYQEIEEINGIYSGIEYDCGEYTKQEKYFTDQKETLKQRKISFKDLFRLGEILKRIEGYVQEISGFVDKGEKLEEEVSGKKNSVSGTLEKVNKQISGLKSVKEDLDVSYKYWSEVRFNCSIMVSAGNDQYSEILDDKWFYLLDDMKNWMNGKSVKDIYEEETRVLFEAYKTEDPEDEENYKYGVCVVYGGNEKVISIGESDEIELENIGKISIDVKRRKK